MSGRGPATTSSHFLQCGPMPRPTPVRLLLGGVAGLLTVAALLLLAVPTAGAQEGATTTTAPAAPTTAPVSPTTPTRITATLSVGDEPVEGVTMNVSRNGEEIGSAESDEDGFVAVEVPGAGQYDVTLDPDSFPEGIDFAEDARTELSPPVLGAGDRPVIFRLAAEGADSAAPAGGGRSDLSRLGSLFASGLRFGLVIGLAAVGLSLIFGTTGLTNFAHGELVTFGAVATWYLNTDSGGLGLPLVVAAVGAVALSGAFGASVELGVFRPLRKRGMPVVSQMVVSIGLALALRYVFSIVFGANSRQYRQYAAQAPSVDIGSVSLRPKDVVVTVVALGALVLVGLFLQRARLGTAIRAVSDNGDLSTASGIDTQRVVLMVWILAGVLAGAGGVMLGATDNISWTLGQRVLLVMFAAVLLGGLGTAFGAMVGGVFVGVISDVSTFWLDADLKIVVALGTLVLVLLIRPTGIFGVRTRAA